MCKRHWYQVPYHLRRAVWNAYDGGAGVGTGPLKVAQANAIEAVNEKLAAGGS